MSNGLTRESIGQTKPERNPSLLVRDAIRLTFYEKTLEVSWWMLCLRRSCGQNPWCLQPLGTSRGTTITISSKSFKLYNSQTVGARDLKYWYHGNHLSHVMRHIFHVTIYFFFKYLFNFFYLEIFIVFIFIFGRAGWRRVCYQLGLLCVMCVNVGIVAA